AHRDVLTPDHLIETGGIQFENLVDGLFVLQTGHVVGFVMIHVARRDHQNSFLSLRYRLCHSVTETFERRVAARTYRHRDKAEVLRQMLQERNLNFEGVFVQVSQSIFGQKMEPEKRILPPLARGPQAPMDRTDLPPLEGAPGWASCKNRSPRQRVCQEGVSGGRRSDKMMAQLTWAEVF